MTMEYSIVIQLLFLLYTVIINCMGQNDVECPVKVCYCIKEYRQAICNDSQLDYIPRLPKYVNSVTFTNTSLRTIDNNGMSNLSFHRMEQITFIWNKIEQVDQNAFFNLLYLVKLTICREPLLDINKLKSSFQSIRSRIRYIAFIYNSWNVLPTDMFNSLNTTNVKILILKGNNFKSVNFEIFKQFYKLIHLDLSSNKIKEINIDKLSKLNYLDLSQNHLSSIPTWCTGSENSHFPNLFTLVLSNNNIGNLDNQSFNCLLRVQRLYIDNLNVARLQNNILSRLMSLETLSLSRVGNPLQYIEEYAFNSSSIKKITMSNIKFHFNHYDKRYNPDKIFASCPNLAHLELSGNYLPKQESTMRTMFQPLKRIQYLILTSTGLHTLPANVFTNMPLLKRLSLDSNGIFSWNRSEDIFGNLSSLEQLTLRQNMITIINETSFPETLLASLKILDLSNNPFACTCNQLWFRNWIERTNITLKEYPKQYKCRVPNSMNGMLLQEYRPTVKSCNPWNPLYTMGIIMGTILALVVLTFAVAVKCQGNIKNYIYLLRVYQNRRNGYLPLSSEEDYEFHAFVVYCDSDRKWVHGELLDKLEKEEGLKMCIHHRNFEAGNPITENVDNFLKKSWKVVVVISNDFAKSEWCQWEVDVVQERRRRSGRHAVLPIMLQTIDSMHMTGQLQTLLDSTPYLRYSSSRFGADLFWKAVVESLRKPLGHPPVSLI